MIFIISGIAQLNLYAVDLAPSEGGMTASYLKVMNVCSYS